MVWHAHLLNPRDFLEDCIRYGKLNLWTTGLPWAAIDSCIDNDSFEYSASDQARAKFESLTGLRWDSLNDSHQARLECPCCHRQVHSPWTTCTTIRDWQGSSAGELGHGFTDRDFEIRCPSCSLQLTHDVLRAQKFREDTKALISKDLPMPGTLLSNNGTSYLLFLPKFNLQLSSSICLCGNLIL